MFQVRATSLLLGAVCLYMLLPPSTTVLMQFPSEWHVWKLSHGKSYSSYKEELERLVIWQANLQYIEAHNVYNQTFGYTLAMNRFGDLSEMEYQRQYSCIQRPSQNSSFSLSPAPLYHPPEDISLPSTVDWHTKGAVSSVQDQGDCCASYAFSAVGAVEGVEALASGRLVALSEQNIIDCSGPYGNHGCDKGSIYVSLEYIVDQGGINTESKYPFEGTQRKCRFKSSNTGASLRSYQRVKKGSEEDLISAVALEGPIAVGIDARHNTFRFYSDGVYDEPNCSTTKLSHAMLVVGYGTENGKDYWLLKNSWGTSWGRQGYIKMARNRNNQCGIATKAMFPTL